MARKNLRRAYLWLEIWNRNLPKTTREYNPTLRLLVNAVRQRCANFPKFWKPLQTSIRRNVRVLRTVKYQALPYTIIRPWDAALGTCVALSKRGNTFTPDWLNDCLNACMSNWVSGWINGWMLSQVTGWLSRWMTFAGWMISGVTSWVSSWMTVARWMISGVTSWVTTWMTVADWMISGVTSWVTSWMTVAGWMINPSTDYSYSQVIRPAIVLMRLAVWLVHVIMSYQSTNKHKFLSQVIGHCD
jgi:hypothetical protein